jgi:hypothetical protein
MRVFPLCSSIIPIFPGTNFYCTDHRDLVMDAAALATRLATDVALVYLDRVIRTNSITFRSYHASAKLVQCYKSSLIAF